MRRGRGRLFLFFRFDLRAFEVEVQLEFAHFTIVFLQNVRRFQQLGECLLVENWFISFLGHDSVFHS